MQTAMSITIGLARKGPVTYFAYIVGYRYRLEGVQWAVNRNPKERLTIFVTIVVQQRRNPVRGAVINERS